MPLKTLRKAFIEALWKRFAASSLTLQSLNAAFSARNIAFPPLDHLAVIDLPGEHSGITVLQQIFARLGFEFRGEGYLPDKQNGFMWLRVNENDQELANNAFPQIVIADFCLSELPTDVATIISHYANRSSPFPFAAFDELLAQLKEGDLTAQNAILQILLTYFEGRSWPNPTLAEVTKIKAVNELLAWVLVCGRKPNHFTFGVHLSKDFANFNEFLQWIENDVKLSLNYQGGRIKGSTRDGIQQASTQDAPERVALQDGEMKLPPPFIEFVWRYPIVQHSPRYFSDYFSDFISQNANTVVESLYDKRNTS